MRSLFSATAAVALFSAALHAQPELGRNDTTWSWSKKLDAGQLFRVRNLNGSVDVTASADAQVHVRAEKSWRRGDPSEVHFSVVESTQGVTVCALWFDDVCSEDGSDHRRGDHGNRESHVSVHFLVQLPKGVQIGAYTVNGSVDVRDATAAVRAGSVNGSVNVVTATGPVNATSVNGNVRARLAGLGQGDMDFTTVNGSVDVSLPEPLDAEVDFRTVNGNLSSDWPMQVSGRMSPREIAATIGKGGRRLHLRTVNGNAELRKLR